MAGPLTLPGVAQRAQGALPHGELVEQGGGRRFHDVVGLETAGIVEELLDVAAWIYDRAVTHGGFNVELIDLAEVNLPMFDEPNHPRFHEYAGPRHPGPHSESRASSMPAVRGASWGISHGGGAASVTSHSASAAASRKRVSCP